MFTSRLSVAFIFQSHYIKMFYSNNIQRVTNVGVAATDGVTLFLSRSKTDDLFLVIVLEK